MIRVVSLLLLVLTTFPVMADMRVVSSAVCADQTVVALIEPEHISAFVVAASARSVAVGGSSTGGEIRLCFFRH